MFFIPSIFHTQINMIEIHNIHKSFNGKKILNGITGSFEPGKCNLLLGASGTGKSVLLKCIVGLVKPDIGNITYDGRVFSNNKLDLKQEIRRKIGMLFQNSALFDSMNVFENVEFPLKMLTNMGYKERKARVEFCLDRVSLAHAAKLMPSEISGGMKKRVGIARAIAPNSTYLFCDEPNSGLDPQTAITIDDLIKEITKEFNITTVIVTHDLNSVIEIGDKIMFLYKGDKLWEGTCNDIMDTDIPELNDFIFANRLMRDAKAADDAGLDTAQQDQNESDDQQRREDDPDSSKSGSSFAPNDPEDSNPTNEAEVKPTT